MFKFRSSNKWHKRLALSTFLIDGVLGSKNSFRESCRERAKTQGYNQFQTPSAILGPTGRRCGVAGGERVPPAPLGWYFMLFFILFISFFFLSLISFIMIYTLQTHLAKNKTDTQNFSIFINTNQGDRITFIITIFEIFFFKYYYMALYIIHYYSI